MLTWFAAWICSVVWMVLGGATSPSQDWPDRFINARIESDGAAEFEGWRFQSEVGAQLLVEQDAQIEGNNCALIDATQVDTSKKGLAANFVQWLDAREWRGKRVRFQAAVKTADLVDDARAQLWFRVDLDALDGERPETSAFDNMNQRPIRDSEWAHYDLVLDVDENADKLVVGMFVIGQGKTWIDDASLEVVDDSVPTTDTSSLPPVPPGAESESSESEIPSGETESRDKEDGSDEETEEEDEEEADVPVWRSPIVLKAHGKADQAPQQPFYSPWLLLALFGILLMVLGGVPAKSPSLDTAGSFHVRVGWISRFALRFSLIYWLLYSFPSPIPSLLSASSDFLGEGIVDATQKAFGVFGSGGVYGDMVSDVVHWTADNVFGIEGALVPNNGSGDTTFAYINLFAGFLLSFVLAALWSLISRRPATNPILRDLLRTYLRYVLAFSMLGYGLAKVGWSSNQFPAPGMNRLMGDWGDSSPMGVAWTFLGLSRPYTVFAGLGELVGALLLIWRRTTMLGAMVVFGVMLNVVMLNYCYDIPVKLYSSHLLLMAVVILLPDIRRLSRVLLWNQPTEPVDYRPAYTGFLTLWPQRLLKLGLVVIGFGIPIYEHGVEQVEHFERQAQAPEVFGSYKVVEFKLNDEVQDLEQEDLAWFAMRMKLRGYDQNGEPNPTYWLSIATQSGLVATQSFDLAKSGEFEIAEHSNTLIPIGTMSWEKRPDGLYRASGEIKRGLIEVTLERKDDALFPVTKRGFRWINEVPFNR